MTEKVQRLRKKIEKIIKPILTEEKYSHKSAEALACSRVQEFA